MYVVEHGIDVPTLGLIAAAWSIAKLVFEPIFGYLADRTSRKPFLVGGAIVLGIATMLPLVFTSAAAMFLLRFISGAAAGAYDPAARGMIVDATDEGERGEAFGIYAAFQMGGFVLGPGDSGADRMLLSLRKTGGELVLVIRDDGRGFEIEKALTKEATDRGLAWPACGSGQSCREGPSPSNPRPAKGRLCRLSGRKRRRQGKKSPNQMI